MSGAERRDRFLADEINAHLRVISRIVRRGKARFSSPEGEESRYAARQAVKLIAEAAEKLSGAFERANAKVPWERFRPFRRRTAHPDDLGAGSVEIDEVWRFMVNEAPRLQRALTRPVFPPDARPGREREVAPGGSRPQR